MSHVFKARARRWSDKPRLPDVAGKLWLAIAVLLPSGVVAAEAEAHTTTKASSSRQARADAVRSIPYARLNREARAKVSSVLASTTIYRRLPSQVIDCDPSLYLFLVEHPDLIVNIWEVLGISQVALSRTGENTFQANDGSGTLGQVEYLYRSHDVHLLYAEGSYEGPIFTSPVRGRCLLVLRTGYRRETSGRFHVSCRLDAFLQLEHAGVEVLAKTFQPLVGAAADHNFRETTAFLASLSRAAEGNHPGMQTMAARLTNVEAKDREQFAALAEQLAVKSALQQTAEARAEASRARRSAIQAQQAAGAQEQETGQAPGTAAAGRPPTTTRK
ncbi:MAG: hypothetical protein WD278_08115 [Pirellulales bacterium]